MGDAIGFSVEQIGVIGLMVIGISFSGLTATTILSSDSHQSVVGEFSAVRLAIDMVGTSKNPATMVFVAKLYEGKTYTIESDGGHLLTLTIFNSDGSVATELNGTQDIATLTTSVKMARFVIDSKDYNNRFPVDIIPTPEGVMLTVPKTGGI
jgi:hypothetical protein